MSNNTNMTSRIPCTPETQKSVKDFANGLGMTYDDALRFMLNNLLEAHEEPLIAGYRLRVKAEAWKQQEAHHED